MNMICPVCGAEYLGWVTRCRECGVAVVPPAEAPNPLDLPEEEQVVYELGGWTLDLQASAAAAMAEAGVPHAFDGPDLVIHVSHEAQVDALLDEVEHGPDGSGGERGPSTLVYELDQWHKAARDELCARLDEGGVPWRMDGDQLVVDPADEQAVDFLVADVRGYAGSDGEHDADHEATAGDDAGDAVAHRDDDGSDDGDDANADAENTDDENGDAGRRATATAAGSRTAEPRSPVDDGDQDEDPEVLGRLYLTAASLADDPSDPEAIVELLDFSDDLDEDRPPFGVDRDFWERVLVVVDDLADAIAGPDLDDDEDEDEDEDDGPEDEAGGPVDDDPEGDESVDDEAVAAAPARSAGRGQFIPQPVDRGTSRSPAPKPSGAGAPVLNEAKAKRLARQLRMMLQQYV